MEEEVEGASLHPPVDLVGPFLCLHPSVELREIIKKCHWNLCHPISNRSSSWHTDWMEDEEEKNTSIHSLELIEIMPPSEAVMVVVVVVISNIRDNAVDTTDAAAFLALGSRLGIPLLLLLLLLIISRNWAAVQ